MTVRITQDGLTTVVTIDRPHVRNAVDRATAQALADAFRGFEADPGSKVAVLTGAGSTFCAGADLRAIAGGEPNRLQPDGDAPMGPSRMVLSKPVIAAISGYAVAGGLELACWADLRVVESDAVLGVFCRRVGVPLIDGGTVRLPRIVGLGRALDLILTGREVHADEALRIGLADRVVPPGQALAAADRGVPTGGDARRPGQCLSGARSGSGAGVGLRVPARHARGRGRGGRSEALRGGGAVNGWPASIG